MNQTRRTWITVNLIVTCIASSFLQTALTTALIAGAALDVTAKEPLPRPSKLLELENFLCTPHIAWYSEEAAQEMKRKVAEEAVRFATGEKVLYPVNQI